MGSTLKGKNLLLKEQILSFRGGHLLRREVKIVEVLPLKEYLPYLSGYKMAFLSLYNDFK